jgi:sugar lactone lactonase YvrE
MKHIITIHLGLLAVATAFAAGEKTEQFKTRVVASGLHRPTGIAIQGNHTIYFTEVPTPGVSGMNGGSNSVSQLSLSNRRITTLHTGEPEPVNIIVGQDNDLYWTCKSAGVILTQDDEGETSVFLGGLQKPSGIAMDRCGNIYFTQVPTPGVNGMNGGSNSVVFAIGTATVVLSMGEPEPADIVVSKDGDAYWTCRTAGVILERSAADGQTRVLLEGLQKPVGIALDHQGRNLYFTEVPTPGVGGMNGGQNKVWQYDLKTGVKTLVNSGDPEPTDVAVSRSGNIYWTCTSAGVIVEARRKYGRY